MVWNLPAWRSQSQSNKGLLWEGLLWVALTILPSAHAVHAGVNRWSTNGPYGANGHVVALAMNPAATTTLYAVVDSGSGFFLSSDGGATWANKEFTGGRMYAIAVDPTNPAKIYVGTDNASVLRSVDGGDTWASVSVGFTGPGAYVRALSVDPLAPSTVYAGLSEYSGGDRLFKSSDSGATWTPLFAGTDVFVLAIDPTTSGTVYAGTSIGVRKSTNGGATWSSVGTTIGYVFGLAIDPTTPATIYAGSNQGIFKSIDAGSNWVMVSNVATNALAIDPNNHNVINAATNTSGVLRSTNGGTFWAAVNTGLTSLTALAFASDPSNKGGFPVTVSTTAYVVTAGGVFKTTTGSPPNWSVLTVGRECATNAVAVDPLDASRVYAASEWDGLFRSVDAGTTWTATIPNPTCFYPGRVKAVAVHPTTPSTVYAAAGGCVCRSDDYGMTWVSADIGASSFVTAVAIDPATPSTVYAARDGSVAYASHGGVLKSIDGGVTWNDAVTGFTDPHLATYALAIDPATPTTLYAGTEAGVFRSTDGAASWSAMNTGLTTLTINALAVDPADPDTVYAATDGGGLFKSTGGSWIAISDSLVYEWVKAVAVDPLPPNAAMIGTFSGIFQSADGGATWEDVSDGLLNGSVNSITAGIGEPSTLYAGTQHGVFDKRRVLATPTETTTAVVPTATATPTPADQCMSAAPLNDCVGGGGSRRTDCAVEFLVRPVPPLNGRGLPRNRVDCYEGDACDADADITNHQCSFDLRLCINNHDARFPACVPSGIASLEVLKPKSRRADAADVANRAALESSAGADGLGVTVVRSGDAIFTGRENFDADFCSDPVRILVPLRQSAGGDWLAARRKIRIRSITSLQGTDTDAISFRCRPSTCGNSIIERDHESCDDGNRLNGDGCNQACQLE